MKIYNSLVREKQNFSPIDPENIKIYQCGPTVYWTQHIGNMRAMVTADILIRTLKYLGYNTKFARNYTDVGHLTSDTDHGEDKMEKGARREGKTPEEIAEKYISIFESDVAKLNTLPPDYKPRATDPKNIEAMIDMVRTLIDKKFAYVTKLAVYFDVSKAKDYTKLSGQKLEFNLNESGHGDISDPNKKNPADFALWFFKTGVHANALQTWESGKLGSERGFPGWHIECSAMIKRLLGETIDIHMGGIEHIPVHHTNEIAQSESANGKPLSRFWMHYEHLLVNGKKMSKSEGTSFSISDIIETVENNKKYRIDTPDENGRIEEWAHIVYELSNFIPLSLRYFFLNSHYRSKQNFTFEALKDAQIGYFRMIKKISGLQSVKPEKGNENTYLNRFNSAISEDLNTPETLAATWGLLGDPNVNTSIKLLEIEKIDKVLGLNLINMASDFYDKKQKESKKEAEPILKLIKERDEAKKNKDYTKADEIRNQIEKLGYSIKDTPSGAEIIKK